LAGAQEKKPLIRLSLLSIEGISLEEHRLIESLILSYLSDFGEVVDHLGFSPGGSSPAFGRSPDYVVSGGVSLRNDIRFFTLEVHNTLTRETAASTTAHKTSGDLVLKARSLVESIFTTGSHGISPVLENPDPEKTLPAVIPPEKITETAVTGTWRGEPGVEMFRLLRNGKGMAVFSSGARMNLGYKIENNILKIRQTSPNTERYYYPLPYKAAKILAVRAEPMNWELSLYENGNRLKGFRFFTGAFLDEEEVILEAGSVMETEWSKVH
jgi:hypothetical protein